MKRTPFSQNPEQEQRQKAEKKEDPEHAEQGGEQAVHEQEEGLQKLDPWKKWGSTCLQRQRLSWNPVGGGSIYSIPPGPHDEAEEQQIW